MGSKILSESEKNAEFYREVEKDGNATGAFSSNENLSMHILGKVKNLQPKLLDLTRRNPLLSTRLSARSASVVRIINTTPDEAYDMLTNSSGDGIRIMPLPPLHAEPADENTEIFAKALREAKSTDEIYKKDMENLEDGDPQEKLIDRALKDRVRESLKLGKRQNKESLSLAQHAKNHNISPSFDLPSFEECERADIDNDMLRTLLLPEDMERRLKGILGKAKTWEQETGIHVLHIGFGFLEWKEREDVKESYAPLILMPVKIVVCKTAYGQEFWLSTTGDGAESNFVLAELLRREFSISLPPFNLEDSLEEYLAEVGKAVETNTKWKVRRQIIIGVFPSASIAMYQDLDLSRHDFAENAIIRDLLGGVTAAAESPFADDYDVDSPEMERKVPHLVMDADSSQISTIIDMASGKNLAVEGPPGTGKSQTIVNAIATALDSGKKVLFIAEKMAALEVVKSRLEAVGLGEFILPLQAKRSSREDVVDSIRKRVELPPQQIPLDYENKLKLFHEARNTLNSYIEIISSNFENSAIKIYDIIGKTLSYGALLKQLDASLLAKEIEDICDYTVEKIESIKKSATQFIEALKEANSNKTYWKFLNVPQLDPFTKDLILIKAENISTEFSEIHNKYKELANFGFPKSLLFNEAKILYDKISQLETHEEKSNKKFISAIIDAKLSNEFIEFVKKYIYYQQTVGFLKDNVFDHDVSNLDETLFKIATYLKSINLSEIVPEALPMQIKDIAQSIATKNNLLQSLDHLKKRLPCADKINFEFLHKAHNLIAQTSHEALALRNPSLAGDSEQIELQRLCREGMALCERKTELEQFIRVDVNADPMQIAGFHATIKTSGLFSFLSSDYREAKKHYISISSRGRFVKEEAITDLQLLLEWLIDSQSFCSNPNASKLFNIHFNGLSTQFNLFEELLTYYKNVKSEFANYINNNFSNFLLTCDMEWLDIIPDIPEQLRSMSYPELQKSLNEEKCKIDSLKKCEKIVDKLKSLLKNYSVIKVNYLEKLAAQISLYKSLKDEINNDAKILPFLHQYFDNWRNNYHILEEEANVLNLLTYNVKYTESLLQSFYSSQLSTIKKHFEQIITVGESILNEQKALSTQTGIDFNFQPDSDTVVKAAQFFKRSANDKTGLNAWSIFASARQAYINLGFQWILDGLDENGSLKLPAITEALIYRNMVRYVYARQGEKLAKYHCQTLNNLHIEIGRLDREIISLSKQYLRARLMEKAKPPMGNGTGKKSTWTEYSLILNELSKKKRFLPARELVRRAQKALLELKPCWMMSPMAVAQYLEQGDLNFDICILDEASQMPPENAVGALVRSRQAMIVGDTNQLPPTNFFKKNFLDEDEEENEEQNVLEESILEMANAAFRPARRLKWHYRSRHSGLIKFSNHYIYNDDLQIFPSPTESRKDMGVALVSVRGNYKSGVNSKEADAIVEAALKFMKDSPDRSLGIVTLNQKQSDLLNEEFEVAMLNNPDAIAYVDAWNEKRDGLENFFIKNLENVQGDERDVIFIGTVYGPEKEGSRVMQRFGPISGMGGKRRLNVLFTRAKKQIVTFSSMTSADILATAEKNPGAWMLKCWLEYSATGRLEESVSKKHEPESDFEMYVINQIKSMGCEAVPQVGVSGYRIDIGVRHPAYPYGYILGVECDGAAYHSSRSARERDRLREEVLTGLGWKLYRIWSTSWFGDPVGEAEKLRQIIESRMKELKNGIRVI